MLVLSRLIRVLTIAAVVLIAAGILLWVLSANRHNAIVSDIHDAARWVVGPFGNVFHIRGAKANLALNWGVALVVYAIVGGFLSRLAARPMARGGRLRRARPVA